MLLNYLKIALRNIIRQKGYSFINITGLAIGMACTILILLWVIDELSFDRFHQNAGNIYRVVEEQVYRNQTMQVAVTPGPLVPSLKAEFPEIVRATRLDDAPSTLITFGDKSFIENQVLFVDPDFFHMFDFPFISGGPNSAFADKYAVVITESTAKKYFGGENPIGQVITARQSIDLTVSGIVRDITATSHIRFDVLVPFELKIDEVSSLTEWSSNSIHSYIMLPDGMAAASVQEKIKDHIRRKNEGSVVSLDLQPLTDIHLRSDFVADMDGHGNIMYVYIFLAIAAFILLISGLNFVSLTTARYSNRAKEVGVRQVAGAYRSQIFGQFISESIIFTLMATICALLVVEFFLPHFNQFTGKTLDINYLADFHFSAILMSLVLIVGGGAGIYPALVLSAFRPASVLKGNIKLGGHGASFRQALVLIQWSLSLILIIGSWVIYNQLMFIKNKELGFDQEHLVYTNLSGATSDKFEHIRDEFSRLPGISRVTSTLMLPTNLQTSTSGLSWPGMNEDEKFIIHYNLVDYDYCETFGMQLAAGRPFSREFATDMETDSTTVFILNEEAVRRMGLAAPVGKEVELWGRTGPIVGVVRDFHFKPFRTRIEPIVHILSPQNRHRLVARIDPHRIEPTLAAMTETMKQFEPNYNFEFQFVSDHMAQNYRTESMMGDLFKYFAGLAILVACLGLFGLASFTAEQRRQEIGIRRVMGASIEGIIVLLSKEFTRWVIVANIIAWPIAWYAMNNWLQNFAYHAKINWLAFIGAGIMALLIALFTVSVQAVRAAVANPVDAIKCE